MLEQRVRSLQIITGAVLFGLVVISATLASFKDPVGEPVGGIPFLLPGLAAFMLASGYAASLVLVAAQRQSLVRAVAASPSSDAASDRDKLMNGILGRTIIRTAMLEGPGIIGAIFAFIEPGYVGFVVPAASVLLQAFHFPTRSAVENELDSLEREVRHIRDQRVG